MLKSKYKTSSKLPIFGLGDVLVTRPMKHHIDNGYTVDSDAGLSVFFTLRESGIFPQMKIE